MKALFIESFTSEQSPAATPHSHSHSHHDLSYRSLSDSDTNQGSPVQEQPQEGPARWDGDGVTWLGPNAILVRSRGRRSALRAAPSLTCRGRPQQGGEQDGGHRQRRERGARSPGPPPAPRSPARGQGLHPHAAAGRASAPKVVTWRAPTRRRKLADGGPEGRTDGHAAASARTVCGRCASLGAVLGTHGRPLRPPHPWGNPPEPKWLVRDSKARRRILCPRVLTLAFLWCLW